MKIKRNVFLSDAAPPCSQTWNSLFCWEFDNFFMKILIDLVTDQTFVSSAQESIDTEIANLNLSFAWIELLYLIANHKRKSPTHMPYFQEFSGCVIDVMGFSWTRITGTWIWVWDYCFVSNLGFWFRAKKMILLSKIFISLSQTCIFKLFTFHGLTTNIKASIKLKISFYVSDACLQYSIIHASVSESLIDMHEL